MLTMSSPSTSMVPACFLFAKDIHRETSGLSICQECEKVTGPGGIVGAQRFRGLWRIYPKTKEARETLLLHGVCIDRTLVSVLGNNPFIVGGAKDTVKIIIGKIPLSVSSSEIEKAICALGAQIRSKLFDECYRDQAGRLTDFKTGRRYVYIDTPTVPLPREMKVAKWWASVYHYGQPRLSQGTRADFEIRTQHPVDSETHEHMSHPNYSHVPTTSSTGYSSYSPSSSKSYLISSQSYTHCPSNSDVSSIPTTTCSPSSFPQGTPSSSSSSPISPSNHSNSSALVSLPTGSQKKEKRIRTHSPTRKDSGIRAPVTSGLFPPKVTPVILSRSGDSPSRKLNGRQSTLDNFAKSNAQEKRATRGRPATRGKRSHTSTSRKRWAEGDLVREEKNNSSTEPDYFEYDPTKE